MESLWNRMVDWWRPSTPEVGSVLAGRYELTRAIGKGISRVFAARDLQLGGVVAIKVTSAAAPGGAARLREEARAAMQLHHPGIVRVHTWDQAGDWEFLVMELVEGEDLGVVRAQHRTLPVTQLIQIGSECLDALAYAHRLGVVHNDIKPHNILLCEGHVRLVDFGLVSWGKGGVQAPSHTGSPPYMCPERLRGEPGDARSDLYALAATLYTLASGRTPYGDLPEVVAAGQIEGSLAPIPGIPHGFEALLRRALSLNPMQRPQTAEQFRAELLACLGDEGEPETDAEEEAGVILVEEVEPPVMGFLDRKVPSQLPVEAPPRAPVQPAPPGMVWVGPKWIDRQGQQRHISAFFIDKTPVTNLLYQQFVLATGEPPPPHWLGTRIPAGKEQHPVVGISAHQARRYAAWKGSRLPSSSEWVAALSEPPPKSCDRQRCQCAGQGATDTAPVGTHPQSTTEAGVADLLGNVWEWTEVDGEVEHPEAGCAPAMGGSFKVACEPGRVPLLYLREAKDWLHVGFRCARGLE